MNYNKYKNNVVNNKYLKRNRRITFLLSVAFIFIIASIFIFMPKNEELPVSNAAGSNGGDTYNGGSKSGNDNYIHTKKPLTQEELDKRQNYTVVIDPGHGYDDPGTGEGYLEGLAEKDIVLDISLKIRDILSEKGFNTVMTREDDVKPEGMENQIYLFNPSSRIEFAESLDACDIFISVHCDSFESDTKVSGTRIYYFEGNTPLTPDYAEKLSQSIFEILPEKAPLIMPMNRENAYHILKGISVPVCLAEVGFVTNQTDRENMLDFEWRQKIAQGIADGIESFWEENN